MRFRDSTLHCEFTTWC